MNKKIFTLEGTWAGGKTSILNAIHKKGETKNFPLLLY